MNDDKDEIIDTIRKKHVFIKSCSKKKYNPSNEICRNCGAIFHSKNINRLKDSVKKEIKILKKSLLNISNQIEKETKFFENLRLKEIDLSKRPNVSFYYKKIDQQNINIENLKIKRERFLNESKRIETIKNTLEKEKSKINPWPKKIRNIKSKISKLRNILIVKIKKIEVMNQNINDLDYTIEAFGNSGIKNDIISSKIALLEDKINYYLAKLVDGDIFVQLDNKVKHGQTERIGVMIQDNKKIKPLDFLEWSGGEMTRIRWSVEYALNSIMETFINLSVVDEGFDDMDAVGVRKILHVMQNESEKRILCISNVPEMKNIFKNHIKVIYKDGYTRIHQAA